MYISNSYFAFTYRVIYLIICFTGLIRHFTPDSLSKNIHMLSYFTIQMNLACFILFCFLVKDTFFEIKYKIILKYRSRHNLIRGMILVAIIIVFLAYNFVLKNTNFSMAKGCPTTITLNDIFVHYLVPIMTFLDWLLFQPKGIFHARDPIIWLTLPICYYFIINIKTVLNACSYPYYFIDINKLGLHTVLNNAVLFVIICLITGYLLVGLDKLLSLI